MLLLLLFVTVGAGVYALWSWHASTTREGKEPPPDASVLHKTEGKLRTYIRQEIGLESVHNASVTAGLQQIETRLAKAIGPTEYPVEIYVVVSSTINAVCLPGSIIVVYSGLLQKLQTPEELAAIVAHEAAHALHGDAMQALEREIGLAALFTLAGGRGDALVGRLLQRIVSAGFSRQQEQAADAEAARILDQSQIDPAALAEALRRLRQVTEEEPEALQYISTHPGIDERIKGAEAASAAWKGKPRPITIDWKRFLAAVNK